MLGADSFRVSSGDPVQLSASGMNLIADMANKFRDDRYEGTEPPIPKSFGQSQWIGRVLNSTGMPLEAGSIVQIGPWPWGLDPFPAGWKEKFNWTEVNDETLLEGTAPTTATRMHAVMMEKCREGGTGLACIGGFAFTRVEAVDSFLDASNFQEWAEIIPGQVDRLKMGGSGAFRIVNFFLQDTRTAPITGNLIVPAIVELQRPGNLSPVYRCFSQALPRSFSNGMQRLVGSVYLPPVSGRTSSRPRSMARSMPLRMATS